MSSDLRDLQKYLIREYPGSVLIPSRAGGKIPRFSHKDGQYTASRFLSDGYSQCRDGCLIILSEDLIVIDVDDGDIFRKLEGEIPELCETVCCETAKGRHYYFSATARSRGANMKDGARQMRAPGGEYSFPIDIKTMSSSGTGGLISIPPSPNKRWLRELGVARVLPMPDAFVDFYVAHNTSPRPEGGGSQPALEDVSSEDLAPVVERRVFRSRHSEMNSETEEALDLLELLAPRRAAERNDWMSVGWCLHNIDASEEMLGAWDRFSRTCPAKYVPGECARLWGTMRRDGLRMGSLHMWARQDSPAEYRRYMIERVFEDVRDCNGSHFSIASIAHKLYGKRYVCASTNGKLWYHFDGTLWEEDPEGIRLRLEMKRDLRAHFTRALGRVRMQEAETQSSASSASVASRDLCERLLRITYRIEDTGFVESVLKAMRDLFYDRTFLARLDANPNLIAFTNGVFELKDKRFRAATYDDWQSLSVGYAWREDSNSGVRDEIVRYMEQLHPCAEQREYMIKTLARQLYGDTGGELFHVHAGFKGSAGNGKTKFFEVLELVLGDYVHKFPVEMLVSKNRGDAHRPVPEYKLWRARRVLYCTEPNADERLNSGVLKELTGGEVIHYRMLYSNDLHKFRPVYKMHIMCNDVPQLDGADEGVRRRIRKVDYVSRFVDASEVDESANRYRRDMGFIDRFKETEDYRLEFLKYLLEHYDHGYKYEMPGVVRENSVAYLEENDGVLKFVRENVVEDRHGWFTLKDAKDLYRGSEYFDPRVRLKTALEKTLRTSCVEQKKIQGIKHKYVFLGYAIKAQEVESEESAI